MNCASCDAGTPPDARFCPSCGSPVAPATPAAERKLVTVVFCDLVGSTALSEALDPETLRVVTLRYFAAMREQIERYGGTVEKYIGDAVMAVFGVPVMHEDDASRAVAATLGMREALAALNAEIEPALGVRLRVRIGVHTGPVVAGTEISTRQALVSGRAVNVAARLQQHAGEGEILIGPLTRAAVGRAAQVEAVGPFQVKGVREPVAAFRLYALGDDAPELRRRFDVPFVGRDRELGTLDRVLDEVAASRAPRLVTVYGDPGIGKTRLLRVWLDRVGRRAVHGAGRCRPYGEHGSLAPLAEAVHQLLAGPSGRTGDASALAVLDAGLLRDGTPGHSLDATCAALAQLLTGLGRGRPVVLVLDDCQWATDPLLDLVDRLAAGTAGAVIFACLARHELLERRPDWARRADTVQLAGLSAVEAAAVSATLAEVSAHAAPGTARLPELAGGNPLYLEQLFAAAAETGRAQPDPANGELPHTLQALLGARLDALDPADRAALESAAVWGREFSARQVTALAPDAGPAGPALARLVRRRMVEITTPDDNLPATHAAGPIAASDGGGVAASDGGGVAASDGGGFAASDGGGFAASDGGGVVFRFSNGLIRDAAYQAMAKRTRAERHQAAAEVLAAERAPAAAVAGHLERAYRLRVDLAQTGPATEALRRRAADLLGAAGAAALTRSDLAWAEDLLARARDLLRTGEPDRAGVLRRLGEVRLAAGAGGPGRELLREVLAGDADPVEAAHARLSLAVADGTPAEETARLARSTLPVFRDAGDELGQARARIRMAQARQVQGRHADAVALLRLGLGHAVRSEAEPERALALGAVGISLWRGPTPVPAAVHRCRALLREHGGLRPMARVTLNCPLAVLLALDGQPDGARECLAEAGRLARDLGYAEREVVLPIFAAAVEVAVDRRADALRELERAAEAARRLAAGQLGVIARESARLLLDLGRPVEAAGRLAAIDGGATLPRADRADLDGLRARLAAVRGADPEATALAAGAVATADGTDSPLVQAVAALDQAETLRLLGRSTAAVEAAGRARRRFEAKGYRAGADRALRLAAGLGAERAVQAP
ncbi:adenylate/guanylate cyclase domain-containing protein [Plantactinospora sp. WMMB334]|uniref:adenylate/guanylate cyclase domain-containing protein n=1 Tax=Plantactinospora sp. WMMB334 TaxID=3404119 RepID=UPI003B94F100